MTCTRIARGFGFGSVMGFAAARERITAHTNRSAATTAYTRGTVLKSTGEDKRGTLLPCRRCSMSGRMCTTRGLPCGATSRRVGTGCEDRRGRGFSPDRARDPAQRIGQARGGTYSVLFTSSGSATKQKKGVAGLEKTNVRKQFYSAAPSRLL